VFLSFRGEDTRASFISHLYASLQHAGIEVFKDDQSLQRGDDIATSLMRTIEHSQISIVVFSTNYAGSQWCLDELVKIMVSHSTTGQVVLPVFFDVDPSDVRHQTGEFGKTFRNLINKIEKESVELNLGIKYLEYMEIKWREELRKAAGQHLLNVNEQLECIQSHLEIGETSQYRPYPEIKWTAALRKAASLAGFVVLNSR